MSLVSLVLTVRPLEAMADLNAMGRASHALLLDAVRWFDEALAETLHTGDGLRPFTASNLIGYSRRRGVNPAQTYTLRFTALSEPVAQALREAAALAAPSPPVGGKEEPPLRPGARARLDRTMFQIEAATTDPSAHPWAAATTYEALSAPWLLGRAKPESRLTIQFTSPTTFKKSDMKLRGEAHAPRASRHIPVPLPELVFNSLLERWNAFAPIAFPVEFRRFIEECLVLGAYQLRTHMAQVKEGGLRAGAVGQARYIAISPDRYWLSLINLLADYALFSGVGAGTTTGLGQCRKIIEYPEQVAADSLRGHAEMSDA